MSGQALHRVGYQNIDGIDFSEEMLDYAREKQTYRNLWQEDLNALAEIKTGPYEAIFAAGIISPSHANQETIDLGLSALRPNGIMVFSFNDHALNDDIFMAKISELKKNKNITFLEEFYGDHIKKLDLKATVYVIQKFS